MEQTKSVLVLILSIIKKGEPLNNSYKLIRILEWQFQINNAVELLDKLKSEHYVDFEILNGVHYYSVTESGIQLLKKETTESLTFLLGNYPDKAVLINQIFETRPS